jgi:hypothetical protein
MSTGTEIEEELSEAKTTSDIDKIVISHMEEDHIPNYILKDYWKEVTIKGNGHTLVILVAPDYFALGTDDDPFRVGRESPFCAMRIADYLDSLLPSTKILREIQKQAEPKFAYTDVKAAPYNIPLAKIETHNALVAANNLANKLFEKAGITPGENDETAIGYRKSIVVGPNLDGSKVAIYGGRWSAAGAIVQPYSTIHESMYSDYSHGVTLVSRKANLDGDDVDLRDDVFLSTDPGIYGLVVDLTKAEGVGAPQVRFDPIFPNAKSSSGGGGGGVSPRGDAPGGTSVTKTDAPKSDTVTTTPVPGATTATTPAPVDSSDMSTSMSNLSEMYQKNKKPILIAGAIAVGGAIVWAIS